MLIDQCKLQAGHKVLIWGAAGGLGVFAIQLCKLTGARCVGVVSSDEKGELCMELGAQVVAEGIETADELSAVIDCGAHYAQGGRVDMKPHCRGAQG